MAETKTANQAAPAAAGTSLLDDILAEGRMKPTDEGYEVARRGVQAFMQELLAAKRTEKVERSAIDGMIAEVDKRLSAQVNEILHHPDFQKLESAWRSLRFVVERTDFRENIKLEMLTISKDDLLADLEDSPDLTKSGFYRIVYSNEYGVFGGKPFGVMNMNYDFGPGAQDVEMMRKLAAIASMAHCPLVANASPQFFGDTSFRSL